MKAAILYLAAALAMGITAAPANAQSTVNALNTLDIFVNPNAPPGAPITLEQDEVLSELKDGPLKHTFHATARDAGIFEHGGGTTWMKPIADWTQRDFRNFIVQARARDRRIDELAYEIFFWQIFSGGGGDGDGAE